MLHGHFTNSTHANRMRSVHIHRGRKRRTWRPSGRYWCFVERPSGGIDASSGSTHALEALDVGVDHLPGHPRERLLNVQMRIAPTVDGIYSERQRD